MSTPGTQWAGKGSPGPNIGGRGGGHGVCKFYQTSGSCRFGSNCKFQHVQGGQASSAQKAEQPPTSAMVITSPPIAPAPPLAPSEAVPSTSITSPGICKSFRVIGRCRVGDGCKYEHVREEQLASVQRAEGSSAATIPFNSTFGLLLDDDDEVNGKRPEEHPTTVAAVASSSTRSAPSFAPNNVGSKSSTLTTGLGKCKFYQTTGSCKFNAKCKFQHVRGEQAASNQQAENHPTSPIVPSIQLMPSSTIRTTEARVREEERRRAEQVRCREEQERKRKEKAERLEPTRRANEEQRRLEWERRAEEERRRQEEQLERERIARVNLEAKRRRDAAVIEQYLVSDAAGLITCAAGLEVQHVVAGFDLCKITIKNLPRTATRPEIADLFIQQGVDTTDFYVYQVKDDPTTRGSKLEAVVIAKAEYGQAIAAGLDGIELGEEELKFDVSENVSWNAMALGGAGRAGPFIMISWRSPMEAIIATYTSREEAQATIERTNGQVFHSHRLGAVLDESPPTRPRFATVSTTSVKITGWPLMRMYEPDFENFVGAQSFNLKALRATPYDHEETVSWMHTTVSGRPGVQMSTYNISSPAGSPTAGAGQEWKIKVHFEEWEDAKSAQSFFDRKKLDSGAYLRAWHPKPLQYSIRIPMQQYRAQKRMWDGLAEKKPGSDAHVHTNPGDRGDVVFVRVVGDDKKAAGSLKVRVESLVAGERLDATCWHSSFFSNRDSKPLFDRVQREARVFVRSDFKTRSLKVYGEPERVEEAKRLIKEEVDHLAQLETRRLIPPPSMAYFVREGLARLKELLGQENVNLNLVTRQITIKGGEEARHHLQRLIDESHAQRALGGVFPLGDAVDNREAPCPVCFNDATTGEQLGCGHRYCADCLRDFLRSAGETKDFQFPLVCLATVDDVTCNVPIAIPLLRAFLTPQAFENLVEAAFTSYLERHPQELKYCTTPDCKQIYRRCSSNESGKRKTRSDTLQCPSCFSNICPGCDEEAHEGMTCEERRIYSDPAEQDRLNEELASRSGFKRCPRCQVLMEKTEGCNHMECKCGAHICWRCMAVFGTGPETYAHMHAAHGGIDDRTPVALQEPQWIAEPNANLVQQQLEAFAEIERLRAARDRRQEHLRREAEAAERVRREEQHARIRREAEAERLRRTEQFRRIRREEEAAGIRREAALARQRVEAEQDRIRREIAADEGVGWCIVM